jgi:hypothetical protein
VCVCVCVERERERACLVCTKNKRYFRVLRGCEMSHVWCYVPIEFYTCSGESYCACMQQVVLHVVLNADTHTHTYIYTHIHIHTYACMYAYSHVHKWGKSAMYFVSFLVVTNIYRYIYIYIYIYIYTHTHIYIYTRTC